MTTLAPSTSGGFRLSNRGRAQVTGTEMSAAEARSVMKTVPTPGRLLTWAIWPSTHTAPRRSIQPEIASATWRTGAGASGEVSRAMGASVGHAADCSGPHRAAARGFGSVVLLHLDSTA